MKIFATIALLAALASSCLAQQANHNYRRFPLTVPLSADTNDEINRCQQTLASYFTSGKSGPQDITQPLGSLSVPDISRCVKNYQHMLEPADLSRAFWLMAALYDSTSTISNQRAQAYSDLNAQYNQLVNENNSLKSALATPRVVVAPAPVMPSYQNTYDNEMHCITRKIGDFVHTDCN